MLFVFELHQSHLFSPSSSDPASILPLAWSLSVISALQWVGSTNTPTWHCLPQANSLFLSQEWMNQSNEWINLGSRSGGGGCSRITIKKQEFLLYFFIRYHETCTVMEYRGRQEEGLLAVRTQVWLLIPIVAWSTQPSHTTQHTSKANPWKKY